MGKSLLYFSGSAAVLAAIVYLKTCHRPEVLPEAMPEDVWWGPKYDEHLDGNTDIRPFRINITDEVIDDLKHRLRTARPFAKPLESVNFEYGFNHDYLAKVVDHWLNRYDWAARQAHMNALPQFKTRLYGLDVHFIHARPAATGKHRVIPLLIAHGWPGSVVEFYRLIPMLTKPRDGFDFVFQVIAPSLPGFGFSDPAVRPGMGPAQIGQIFVELMDRLGHKKFYVQGGDWGAVIVEAMAKLFPDRVSGLHSNMCMVGNHLDLCDFTRLVLGSYWPSLAVSSEMEQQRTYPLSKLFSMTLEETGYMHIQMTKPDTAGVGLNESPVGLAAWILEKFSIGTNLKHRQMPDGGLSMYDMDDLLDNVVVYWISGSITTSMRLYSEYASAKYRSLPHNKAPVKVPAACANFPHEINVTLSLKRFLKKKYTKLIRVTEMADGGHFAAFERPEFLSNDIWTSIKEIEQTYYLT
ncbi:juvenile hormone epoxide hydrolase 1-like [Adelges cooleyi]|uniref:juvenile hormone epoxide hydrolase 1-like n=1 Tax=Adelges cooleyi TaxID=133065 RepID=UPI00217FCAE3|nr:juvenile hormone epoxide hydrolase 1-like [Adelges cooleyi]